MVSITILFLSYKYNIYIFWKRLLNYLCGKREKNFGKIILRLLETKKIENETYKSTFQKLYISENRK